MTYSKKSNARRAAITELGPDAVLGVDFHLSETEGRWSWSNRPQPATRRPRKPPPRRSRAARAAANLGRAQAARGDQAGDR